MSRCYTGLTFWKSTQFLHVSFFFLTRTNSELSPGLVLGRIKHALDFLLDFPFQGCRQAAVKLGGTHLDVMLGEYSAARRISWVGKQNLKRGCSSAFCMADCEALDRSTLINEHRAFWFLGSPGVSSTTLIVGVKEAHLQALRQSLTDSGLVMVSTRLTHPSCTALRHHPSLGVFWSQRGSNSPLVWVTNHFHTLRPTLLILVLEYCHCSLHP